MLRGGFSIRKSPENNPVRNRYTKGGGGERVPQRKTFSKRGGEKGAKSQLPGEVYEWVESGIKEGEGQNNSSVWHTARVVGSKVLKKRLRKETDT